MDEDQVLNLLRGCEAILLDTHVVLTPKEDPPGSKQYRHFHSDGYVWKDRLYEDVASYHFFSREIAHRVNHSISSSRITFVVGPEKGAIALANIVAGYLGVRAAYAEKKSGGGFLIGRGFGRRLKGSQVLIVEDIAVSGTTIRDTIAAVEEVGGVPVMAVAICARENVDTRGVPFQCLCMVSGMNRWPEENCPRCQDPKWGPRSVRLDVNSHGREFLERLDARATSS